MFEQRKPKPSGTNAPETACEHGKRSRELCEVCSVEAQEREMFEVFWASSGFEKFKDTGYACWLARAAILADRTSRPPEVAQKAESVKDAWRRGIQHPEEIHSSVFIPAAAIPAPQVAGASEDLDAEAEKLIEEADGCWHDDEFRINGRDLMRLVRAALTQAKQEKQ